MRRLAVLGSGLLIAVAYSALSALPAFSAGDATVHAQVRTLATEPCISLDSTSISFGALPFSTEFARAEAFASPDVVAQSCSSQTEQLFVHGTDATGPSAFWELHPGPGPTCDLGPNMYRLESADFASRFAITLSKTPQQATFVAPDESFQLRHRIEMPCAGSGGAGTTMTMQILYTTTF